MRRLLPAALCLVALTACGTTVPLSGQASSTGNGLTTGTGTTGGLPSSDSTTGGSSTGTSTGGDLGSTSGRSTSTSGGTSGGSTGTSSGSASGSTSTDGGSSLVPGGAKVGPSGTAPGVTAKTIKIGIFTAQGFGDFAASAGFSVATGNQEAEAKAIISYINAHGGLGGRQIIPVFHDESVAGAAANVDNEYTSACAAWTQDDRVYAVISPVGTVDNTLYDCLSKAGVPTITAGDSNDASMFQQYANYYYDPTDMNLRRIMSNMVDGLFAAGFFGAKPKVAVVRVDNNNESLAVTNGLIPALARHGLTLTDSAAVPGGTDVSGYQAAVLKFKAEGITHVLFTYLGSPLLFMTNADNQKYYPRYGLHSRNSPAALLQGSAPAKQQHLAMGIGWQPYNDVDSGHDPGVLNARQKLCLKLLQDSGQAGNGRVAGLLALWMCDNFFFLQDALKKAPTFTMAGLRQGAESLGTIPAASTFKTTFAPGRLHDGAGEYRIFAFKDDCTCYQYVSGLKTAT